MDVLQYIYANIDGTLAHRCACNGGYCNVCLVRCNGKNINPCRTFMSKKWSLSGTRAQGHQGFGGLLCFLRSWQK